MPSSNPDTILKSLIEEDSPEKILQHLHNHKILHPSLVLDKARSLLQTKLSTSKRLNVLEQITISALHEQQFSIAENSITEICDRAGKSSLRYRKLLALCLESQAEHEKALEVYNDMLEDNKANIYALKRKYSILRSRLEDVEARRCLNDYLERNASDAAAWVEMAKTCMEYGDYSGASFCYEEIVLFSPMDVDVHCKLGELYVTIGGRSNLTLARKHFSQSLELDKNCVRAMYGLVSASDLFLQLVEEKKGSSKKNKSYFDEDEIELVKELKKYGISSLMKAYKGSSFYTTLLKAGLASSA